MLEKAEKLLWKIFCIFFLLVPGLIIAQPTVQVDAVSNYVEFERSTNPVDSSYNNIVISSVMPQNNTYPKSSIIDTLTYQSHVQLILSSCYGDTSDLHYPEIILIANDVVKTFAFVWLPENWTTLSKTKKRMIIHLHGHCSIGTKPFCKWYELSNLKNIAVLSLQYWMGDDEWHGGNPSPGPDYPYYTTAPGQTCGWHLNIDKDIVPFIDELTEFYDVNSVMLHGFSMAAATGAIVNYRDKNFRDIIDFTIFNAGHISENHYFRREIDSISNPYSNENFFFFLENFNANTFANQSETRSFLLDKGVTDTWTVIAEGNDYKHGALINHDDFKPVRERIVSLYDSLTTFTPVTIQDINKPSVTYSLSQNFPNPFNPETKITYDVPQPGFIVLKIFNQTSQIVRTLINEYKSIGEYSVIWDGRDDQGKLLASGIYFYRLNAGNFYSVKKMIKLN